MLTVQPAGSIDEIFAPNRLDTQELQAQIAVAVYPGRSRSANQALYVSIRDCWLFDDGRLQLARSSDPLGAPQRISTQSFEL